MDPTDRKILIIVTGNDDLNNRFSVDKVLNVMNNVGLSPVVYAGLPEEHYTPKCIVIGMGHSAEEIIRLHDHIPERGIIITCADIRDKNAEDEFIQNLSELKIQRHIPIERLVLTARSDIIDLPSFEKSARYPRPKNIPFNKYSTKPKGLRHGR